MFERLKIFLGDLTGRNDEAQARPDEVSIAVVALALHVIRADGLVDFEEKQALETAIREHFGLGHAAFETLLVAATKEEDESIDHYRFASYLKRHLDDAAKREFIGILWTLAHADGRRNELEDHMVSRIAETIGVSSTQDEAGIDPQAGRAP